MGGKISRTGALLLAVLAGALSVLFTAAPALAHNPLTASDPKDGARVAKAPSTVRLTFLSRVDPGSTNITVTGPGGAAAGAGRPAFAGNKITVPLRAGAAGVYTVSWQMVADDGDKVGGKLRFTLTVPATTPPPLTPTAAAPPPTATATSPSVDPTTTTSAPAVVAAPSTQPTSAQRGTNWLGWIIFAVLAAIAATLAALLVSRRTRRMNP